MTYHRAADYLAGLVEARILPGLERIAQVLEILGQPHRTYPHILIGGTNGKGSTLALMGSVLLEAGFRTGLYTSPHLSSFEERIRIGNHLLPKKDLPGLVEDVRAAGVSLSYFEFVTAMALLHFARCRVDLAILEVGLGGRWDATNATDPILSVITRVDLDHCQGLGETIEEVAGEKACIMRPQRPVVLGPLNRKTMDLLLIAAEEKEAVPLAAGRDFTVARTSGGLSYKGKKWSMEGLRPALQGRFQDGNAACALASLEWLAGEGFDIPDRAVRRGLETTRWPGRFQVFKGPPRIIVDSAHNPAAMAALVESLGSEPGKTVWLFSALKEKDVTGIIREMQGTGVKVVVVSLDHPRAMDLGDLKVAFEGTGLDVLTETGVSSGFRRAVQESGQAGTVVVAGSVFLAGAVLESLDEVVGD